MSGRSELDRFQLYYEAPRRGEELEKTLRQLSQSIRRGLARFMPLMPYLGRRKR